MIYGSPLITHKHFNLFIKFNSNFNFYLSTQTCIFSSKITQQLMANRIYLCLVTFYRVSSPCRVYYIYWIISSTVKTKIVLSFLKGFLLFHPIYLNFPDKVTVSSTYIIQILICKYHINWHVLLSLTEICQQNNSSKRDR